MYAENGVLVVKVSDPRGRPLAGVQLRAEGGPPGARTDVNGIARLALGILTKGGSSIKIDLLDLTNRFEFISPWDGIVTIPPFEESRETPIVLAKYGDRAILQNPKARLQFTTRVLETTRPSAPLGSPTRQVETQLAVDAVSKAYGLGTKDVDQAIRNPPVAPEGALEKGLRALYEGHPSDAAEEFRISLSESRGNLARAKGTIFTSEFLLASSLFEQGKYLESSTAYEHCLTDRPDDSTVLNNLGLSLLESGQYAKAESNLRAALAIRSTRADLAATANTLVNLARALSGLLRYTEAIDLNRRALALLGHSDSVATATVLNNLGSTFEQENDFPAAESYYRQALAAQSLMLDDTTSATILNNLGALLQKEKDDSAAERLLNCALSIDRNALGRHPNTGRDLSNLGVLLKSENNIPGAEEAFRESISIFEETLGDFHPRLAIVTGNLGMLMVKEGNYTEAQELFDSSIAAFRSSLGANPQTAKAIYNLGMLKSAQRNPSAADTLREALDMEVKVEGADASFAGVIRRALMSLQEEGGR